MSSDSVTVPGRSAPSVSLTTCTALVIANIIGTGVFTSLGFQLFDLRPGFPILLLWITGGVFALCGALSYAELASALPRSGGEYHFLSKIYHPALGFMAGLTSATVGFAAPIAIAAMAFGKYLGNVFPDLPPLVSASGIVLLAAFVHSTSLRTGSVFQNTFTTLKILLILVFIIAGFWMATPQPIHFAPMAGDFSNIFQGPFAVALVYVMYSYSGWNAAVYIAGEVRDPERTVARSLLIGTLCVTVLYVLLNTVFMYAAPAEEMKGQIDVGHVAARHIFGVGGGKLMAGLISIGLISAISSMTWAGPRVLQTMGRDFPRLALLGSTSSGGIPRTAMLFQTVLVVVLLLTTSFENIVLYTGFTLNLCAVLTVAGVMVLRWRQPGLMRPFRCPLYPLPPIIFLLIGIFTLCYMLSSKPMESLAGLATLSVATLLYLFIRGRPTAV